MNFIQAKNAYLARTGDFSIDSMDAADQRETVANFMHDLAEKLGTDQSAKEQAAEYKSAYENLYNEAAELKKNTIENGMQKLKDAYGTSDMTDEALKKQADSAPKSELYNQLYNSPYETDLGDLPLGKRISQRKMAYAHTNLPDDIGTGLRAIGTWIDLPVVTQAERLAQEGLTLKDTDKMGKLKLVGHSALNAAEWFPGTVEKVAGKVASVVPKIGPAVTHAIATLASPSVRPIVQGAESGLSSTLTSPRDNDIPVAAATDVLSGSALPAMMGTAGKFLGRGSIKKAIKEPIKKGNVWVQPGGGIVGGPEREQTFNEYLQKNSIKPNTFEHLKPIYERQKAEQADPAKAYITEEAAKYMKSHGGKSPNDALLKQKFATYMAARNKADEFAANESLHPGFMMGPQMEASLKSSKDLDAGWAEEEADYAKTKLNKQFENRYGKDWKFDSPAETFARKKQAVVSSLKKYIPTAILPRQAAKAFAPSEEQGAPDYNTWEIIPNGYKWVNTISKIPIAGSIPLYRDPKKARTVDLKYGLPQWMLN